MFLSRNALIIRTKNMINLFPKQTLGFTCLHYKSFENTVGKGASFLPIDKILHWSKLKVFADDKINVYENLNLVWEG